MKKNSLLLVFALVLISFTSCNRYHSINNAKSVRQLGANPFLKKVARSVITNISQDVISKGMTSFKGKPLLRSSLSSLLNTSQSVSTFKNMISNTYGIPKSTVESKYSGWNSVRDVIGFVAKNGKRYDFNSYSNKLF
jgi:hypothetical protein